ITYADGSVQHFQLGFTDWTLVNSSVKVDYGNNIVTTMPYRNTSYGPTLQPTYVFYAGVALDPRKHMVSFTLPNVPGKSKIHVFAWSVLQAP
ncbi:MAG: hypothetical protein JWO59_465, partial [Chloroflexi bacterium]|nr:hypothetical protein [Chloroflexota bacterium]